MRRCSYLLLPVVLLFVLVGLLSCMQKPPSVENPPPPPPPARAVDIWLSVENSASMSASLDHLPGALQTLVTCLSAQSADYRIRLLRNTENADGNYDVHPQGPTPVVSSADADPAGELAANVAALRAAHVGSSPMPLEILNRAIFAPGFAVDKTRHQLLVWLGEGDATNYLYNADQMASSYHSSWDRGLGSGNWAGVVLQTAGLHNNPPEVGVVLSTAKTVSPGSLPVDGDMTLLANGILLWQ